MLRKKRRLALWLSVIMTVMSVLPQSQTAKAAETIFNEKGYEIDSENATQNNVAMQNDTAQTYAADLQEKADKNIEIDYAKWINGIDIGDDVNFKSMGGADETAYMTEYNASVSTKGAISPISAYTSKTGTTYNIYSKGMGCTNGENYYYFVLNPDGKYGDYNFSLEMKGSGTGAKNWDLSYSTDGKNFSKISTFSIDKASAFQTFEAGFPEEANASEKLLVKLSPNGSKSINNGSIGSGGTNYLSNIKITASPAISDKVCRNVTFKPAEGEVVAGQEIELVCEENGAVIYYSINDGEYQVYDNDNKPVLTSEILKNGAVVKAKATVDGKADSVVTQASYTQMQVNTVNATPNGGAVKVGKEIGVSCDTEGAKIMYSSDNGQTWSECKENKIVIDKLPITYLVKGVKDGCKDSQVVTLKFTERKSDRYNIYFGQLHSHTSYSDGAGTCKDAYDHAKTVPNLDFLAVTDHSNSFDNDTNASISDGSMSSEWTEGNALAKSETTDDFVGLFGYEMTWSNGLGHINTFNTEGFQSRSQSEYSAYSTALQKYYATLKTQPDSISQFNHPGTTFGDFSDFAYYDDDIDKVITTIEVGNGEGAIGSSGYFPSYEYYQRALDKGWHVAPTNNQDNHKGLWGDANTARSVVLADSLTQDNIYDAMRNYRVYATEDNDLNIYYTLDGYDMGTILEEGQTGKTVELKADLKDATDESIGKVQVITNGGLVLDEKDVTSNNETVTFNVENNYSYYYLKITQKDGDIAVTAPVWVGHVEAAGINDMSTDEVLPVKGKALNVKLDLYNNETSDLELTSIDFKVGDEIVKTVDSSELTAAELTKIASKSTGSYDFDFTYDGVGSMQLIAEVHAVLNGVSKLYTSKLKLNYVVDSMVTKVIIDGTHYNDYVTGYYGANMGNFTKIAGDKSVKVQIVKDEITPEMLKDCSLLIISAPAKKTGTANAGAYSVSHFSDEFIKMVKDYTDNGGELITCGIADYQDSTDCQSSTEINKLLKGIGATTRINSDEAYDTVNNGGQAYRLYLKNYNKNSKYLKDAVADTTDADGNVTSEGQKYSAYSGCTVALDSDAVAAGNAEALISGYDTTYSIDCKDENGKTVSGSPTYVEKGNMVSLAHEKLDSGANVFVAGSVFMSDFEVKASVDNIWDLQYLNKTIMDNILDEVKVKMPVTSIKDVRTNGAMGDMFSVEGYVTAGTSVSGNTFFDTIYVQDDTAGITVFPYSTSGLELGTKVRITGYVDAYQGDKELQLISSEVLDAPKVVKEPESLSAADAMDYEKSGGKLVKVTGTVTRVTENTDGGVSQFWLKDESGSEANIFIDGYIVSASTGKNTLADIVKEGRKITAAGLVYAHPEGASDEPVICLRVRNCDEITAVTENPTADPTKQPEQDNSTQSPTPEDTKIPSSDGNKKEPGNINTQEPTQSQEPGSTNAQEPSQSQEPGSTNTQKPTQTKTPGSTNTQEPTQTDTPKNTQTPSRSEKKTKKITVSKTKYTKVYGDKAFKLGAKTTAGEKLAYSVSNKKVISVDKNGKVTIKKCGTVVVTITSPESVNYKKAVKKITITVKPTVVKSVSVKSAGKGKLNIKWKKSSQADGYIIKYIGNGKTKTKDVKAANKTSAKLTGLLAGKKYKVSVCAYVKSGSKKLCGDFSKIKNVKVK